MQNEPDNWLPCKRNHKQTMLTKGAIVDMACVMPLDTISSCPWIYSMNIVLVHWLAHWISIVECLVPLHQSCLQWMWANFGSIKTMGFVAYDFDGILDSFDHIFTEHMLPCHFGTVSKGTYHVFGWAPSWIMSIVLERSAWTGQQGFCLLGHDVTMFGLAGHFSNYQLSLTPNWFFQQAQFGKDLTILQYLILCGFYIGKQPLPCLPWGPLWPMVTPSPIALPLLTQQQLMGTLWHKENWSHPLPSPWLWQFLSMVLHMP